MVNEEFFNNRYEEWIIKNGFYFIFDFIYFVVVLDIDKKYDVKCNMKE